MPGRLFKTLCLAACTFALTAPAHAQQIVLDEEFSQACATLTNPLRGNLAPNTPVHFVVVADPEINAFVTGENVVYVFSGLIERTRSPAELQGVLAHELGHVAGHHIFQGQTNAATASLGAIGGAILGLGAAVAGAPQVGSAIFMGSQAGAISSMLAHTRTQEQEADRYAANALHSAGYSVKGMVDMFTTLRTESQLSYDSPPPWLVTHPLPPARLSNLLAMVAQEKSGLKQQAEGVDYPRIKAKVAALTGSAASVLRHYSGSDDPARYARAIAYLNNGKLAQAESSLAPLLAKAPDDAFYQELAGQIATQHGNLPQARKYFEAVLARHPSYLMVRFELAETLRAENMPKEALAHYTRITQTWGDWSEAWQGQGLVLGQLGRLTESHLCLTEAALAAADAHAAKQSLALAKNYLKKNPNADQQAWADGLQSRVDRLKDTTPSNLNR